MVYNDAGDGGLPKGTNQIGGCGIIKLSGISGGGVIMNCVLKILYWLK